MTEDRARGTDIASVTAFPPPQPERGIWHTLTRVEKYHDGIIDGDPDEVVEVEGNLLTFAHLFSRICDSSSYSGKNRVIIE